MHKNPQNTAVTRTRKAVAATQLGGGGNYKLFRAASVRNETSIYSIDQSNYLDQYPTEACSPKGVTLDYENFDTQQSSIRRKEFITGSSSVHATQQQSRKYSTNSSHSPIHHLSTSNNSKLWLDKTKNSSSKNSVLQQPLPRRVSGINTRSRVSSTILPSLSSDKKTRLSQEAPSTKLESCVRGLHTYLLEQTQKKNSPFSDILFLGISTSSGNSIRTSTNKTFLSSRLDCNIVSKNFDNFSIEKNKRAYEEEKLKHKALEGKVVSLVDLLAYDDVGLRLFYEQGSVNLLDIHMKYIQVSISFSENDLLCLTRQLIRAISDFAVNSWFFNGFNDLSHFILSKSPDGFQNYSIKIASLHHASTDPSQYDFDTNSLNFPMNQSCSYQTANKQQQSSPQLNSRSTDSSGVVASRSNKDKIFTRGGNQHQTIDRSLDAIADSSTMSSNRESRSQPFTIWDKIFGQEIQQICALIYQIFIEQNARQPCDDGSLSQSVQNGTCFNNGGFGGNNRLAQYLTSLFREAYAPTSLGAVINKLFNDMSIPQTIIIENTLIEQIRMVATLQQPFSNNLVRQMGGVLTNAAASLDSPSQIGKTLTIMPIADEIRSISMISAQTMQKRCKEELTLLLRDQENEDDEMDFSIGTLPKSFDIYESILNINFIRKQNLQTLTVILEIINRVIQYVNEATQPFSYADLLLSKAFILYKIKFEGANPMQLAKHCIQIINRVQKNESNEICGASYLFMSEMASRSTTHRSFALEYAVRSYEIRKQVHGAQSRTFEIVESLWQVARMQVLKGNLEDAIKSFDKAAIISEELKGGNTHRIVIEIMAEHALVLFNMDNFPVCIQKCEVIIEAHKKCGDHLMSFCFPFAMNLLCLTRLVENSQRNRVTAADANSINQVIGFSLNAAKIAVELKGPEPPQPQQQQQLLQQLHSNSQQTTATSDKSSSMQQQLLLQYNHFHNGGGNEKASQSTSAALFFQQLRQLQSYFSKDIEDFHAQNSQQSPKESRFKIGKVPPSLQTPSSSGYSRIPSSQARSLSTKHSNIGTKYLKHGELTHQNSADSSLFYA